MVKRIEGGRHVDVLVGDGCRWLIDDGGRDRGGWRHRRPMMTMSMRQRWSLQRRMRRPYLLTLCVLDVSRVVENSISDFGIFK